MAAEGSDAMVRVARRIRNALGIAGCAVLAACAGQGEGGAQTPFDVLAMSGDGSEAAGDGTPDTTAGGAASEKASAEAERRTPTDTSGPRIPDTAEKPGKRAGARDAPAGASGNMGSTGTAELTPRYCYRTLGAVDCYRKPQPERRRQRVGSFHDTVH